MVVAAKTEVRGRLRSRRDALSRDERQSLSLQIRDRFLSDLPKSSKSVALYAAIGSEVETADLFDSLRKRHVEVYYPACEADSRLLRFVRVSDSAELRPGMYDIPEPQGEAALLGSISLVTVPGLAFDLVGRRIGYGAGYYDRTLANYSGRRVGLAFDFQLIDEIPADAYDIRLDWILTESRSIDTRQGGAK